MVLRPKIIDESSGVWTLSTLDKLKINDFLIINLRKAWLHEFKGLYHCFLKYIEQIDKNTEDAILDSPTELDLINRDIWPLSIYVWRWWHDYDLVIVAKWVRAVWVLAKIDFIQNME